MKILIVEDEAIVAMDLEATLTRLGNTVVGRAARGEDVVEMARRLAPDLLLMDIRLAGQMDGIEAARRVRGELKLPFIFLTAHTDEATLKRARTVEPYGYIVKPFDETSVRTQMEMAQFRHEAELARSRLSAIEAENKRLADLNQMRAQFVSMASHELNTPLTPIQISLQLLSRTFTAKATPEEMKSLALLERNFRRLANLVKDLLEAARLQSKGLAVQFADVELKALVEGVVQVFRHRSEETGVGLDCKADAAQLPADAGRLTQVLTNLIDNAFKFTPKGGHIDVTAQVVGNRARIEVKDSGRGLTADQIGRLFQPFSMVHEYGAKGQGTGLGLYISRTIAEMHGGTLTCTSGGSGKGTEFTLDIPLGNQPTAAAPST